MFGSKVLEIAIGLSFVYFLLSVVTSALNEATSALLALRAATFGAGLEKLLGDKALSEAVRKHPLVTGLSHTRKGPSYVAKATFAVALIDVTMARAGKGTGSAPDLAAFRVAIASLPDATRGALSALLDDTVKDVADAKAAIEGWFDEAMARVSGLYKRTAQVVVVVWAVLLSAGVNADTVAVTKALAYDPAVRAQIVTAAVKQVQSEPPPASPPVDGSANVGDAGTALASSVSATSEVDLPLGWSLASLPRTLGGWLVKVFGLLFTAVAVSLGAPFWFDALNRIVNLRINGQPPDRAAS